MTTYTNWTKTIDEFAVYDNLLSFSIGDEVINGQCKQPPQPQSHSQLFTYSHLITDPGSVMSAPYVKAAARDIKGYRDARGHRSIPISYCTSDLGDNDIVLAEYLACDKDDNAIDMYGINIFSWCGDSNYYESQWNVRYDDFQHYNIPTVFSEIGCEIPNQERKFGDVSAMLGSVFPNVFSGAIVYEWPQQKNGYGIVTYTNAEFTGFPVTLDDFNKLSTVFSTAHPTGTDLASYTPTNSRPSCPTSNSGLGWPVDPSKALPTIPGLDLATVSKITTTAASKAPASTGGSSPDNQDGTNSNGSHKGLSGGAIAGIVIGILAVLVIIALIAFFLRRKKKATKGVAQEEIAGHALQEPKQSPFQDGSDASQIQRSELQAMSVGQAPQRQELDAHNYYHGGGQNGFDQPGVVHELDSQPPYRHGAGE